MASRNAFVSNPSPSFIYPASSAMMISDSDSLFEFDESEIWNERAIGSSPASSFEQKKWIPSTGRKFGKTKTNTAASSLPVNVPDWSKILKQEDDRRKRIGDDFGEYSDGDFDPGAGDDRVPPHEYLARARGASFSVQEGVGRTLKGRDLRRVRNAIWKKVGFED